MSRKKRGSSKPRAYCHSPGPHDPHDWTGSEFGVGDSIDYRCPGVERALPDLADFKATGYAEPTPIEPPEDWERRRGPRMIVDRETGEEFGLLASEAEHEAFARGVEAGREHDRALADRYRRALETAWDAMRYVRAGDADDWTRVGGIVSDALVDPRPGDPPDRIHWLHIEGGDKLVWQLVAELRALRDAERARQDERFGRHAHWRSEFKRAERYRRALVDLHRAHKRSRKAERTMSRTIGRQRALLAELTVDAEVALEAERENKLNAVRSLRRAMRNAISALGSIPYDSADTSTISGAVQHLGVALRDVIDPDDGGVH